MKEKINWLWTIALAVIVCAIPVFGQLTSGNLVGTVYDPTGASVPGATVTATNTATNVESKTTSTSSGQYQFTNLPVGSYSVTVDAVGFSKFTKTNVQVELNVTDTENFNLAVGQAATTVEVSSTAVPIDTTTAQVQSTFDSKQMADLPAVTSGGASQGVLNLSLLSAGVASQGSVGAGTGPSVGGQRPRNNNFTIEGIDNNSVSVTGPLVHIPNDAVSEFTLLENQFSPDFGHSSGGQFNEVVKSGANAFHGDIYEYFQNRNLNAADTIAAVDGTPLHPRFDSNRFGGTFGGPIIKDKLFFFVDYEYNPIGQAGSAGLIFAPTAAGYSELAGLSGINANNLAVMKQYLGTAPSANAPATFLSTGTQYGALYDYGSKNAGVTATPALPTGACTGPGVGYTCLPVGQISIQAPNYFNYSAGVVSIDYNISDKDSLRGRFIENRDSGIDTTANLPAFYTTQPDNYYLLTVSEYHNFSPTLENEFRAGYNRQNQNFPAGNFAFSGLDQFPNLVFSDLGGVQLGPDPNAPQFTYQNTYELTDNVTLTKSRHSFKFGFDGERLIAPQAFTQRARGDYEYSFLSDYLYDYIPDDLAERSAGNPIYWGNRWMFGWYGNDNFKLRSNLTINLGLRYEYQTVPSGEEEQSLNSLASVPGLITFNAPTAQTNAFMPRVGIAYSPGTSGRTSIRAGFGITYDILFDNFGLLSLPPQLSTTQDATPDGVTTGFLASGALPANGPSGTLSAADARANTSGYVPNQTRPEAVNWNFGIQHEFGNNWIFETRYVGTRGEHLPVQDRYDVTPIVNSSNALPVYWTAPSQATLNSLTNTLAPLLTAYNNGAYISPAFANAGFQSLITAYEPYGDSIYHGWANQLTRRFSNGLQMVGSYTWSHNIDNSTAEVFSTVTTPRRPEDPLDLGIDRSDSALDHRQRLSLEVIYDTQYFKHSNWLLKNIVGNWELAPVYTYQTGTWYTVQSAIDANLDGDAWPDRTFVNPNGGSVNIGSGTTPLTNSAGDTVAYLVNNSAAKYAVAPKGTLPDSGRNTQRLPPIDNIDFTLIKRFSLTERFNLQFSAEATNLLNHPQWVGGYLNDVGEYTVGNVLTSGNARDFATPTQSAFFNQPSQVFSSNPRSLVIAAKITF